MAGKLSGSWRGQKLVNGSVGSASRTMAWRWTREDGETEHPKQSDRGSWAGKALIRGAGRRKFCFAEAFVRAGLAARDRRVVRLQDPMAIGRLDNGNNHVPGSRSSFAWAARVCVQGVAAGSVEMSRSGVD